MLHVLTLLAASLGQVHANDGPPRQWLPAVVDGKTVWLWGWRAAGGGVSHLLSENPQVYLPRRPVVPTRPALTPGQTIGRDGAINNGLTMGQAKPTVGITTNDPDLARKLSFDELPACQEHANRPCPGPGPCPRPRVPDVPPPPWPSEPEQDPYEDYYIPGAILLGAVIVAVFVRRQQQ